MRTFTSGEIREFASRATFDPDVLRSRDDRWPRITVVTSSYNQERYIERTLLSVLNQNYPNLEYIVVDDASPDGSNAVVERYADHVTLIRNDRNKGQSPTLNRGFEVATGELVTWQNSDDVYMPGALNTMAEVFQRRSDADVVYGNRYTIDEEDRITGELRYVPFSPLVFQYDGISVSNQSALWRRSLFERIGYIDPTLRYTMDYEFFLRAAKHGARFAYVRHFLGAARRYSANRTNQFTGTSVFESELGLADERHGRHRVLNRPLKIVALLYRAGGYLIQGDLDYVVRGARRRLADGRFIDGTDNRLT